MQARVLSFGNHKTSLGIKSQSYFATLRVLRNTSLAALGPLAYRLECRTDYKIQNGCEGSKNGQRGLIGK